MTPLPGPAALRPLIEEADASSHYVDKMALAGRLSAKLPDPGSLSVEERRGAFAEIEALRFQRPFVAEASPWGIYWRPLSGMLDKNGKEHHSPDALRVDEDIIAHWILRAETAKHPELRARFADLAWEIGRLLRDRRRGENNAGAKPWTLNIPHTLAQCAIDGSLEAVSATSAEDEYHAWQLLDRAIRLAISLNDRTRIRSLPIRLA